MCGRYALDVDPGILKEHFGLSSTPELARRYNIAPTQPAPIVRCENAGRTLRLLRWGLIPHWAKDVKIGHRMINARAESVASKPAFREAFRLRRCLVPASGFFEWKRENGGKRPFYIHRTDGMPLAMAGLWERWRDPSGEEIESFTILTVPADSRISRLHDRMPCILPADAYDAWLDPDLHGPAALMDLLRAPCTRELEAYPVSPIVNNPAHDSPACVQRQRA